MFLQYSFTHHKVRPTCLCSTTRALWQSWRIMDPSCNQPVDTSSCIGSVCWSGRSPTLCRGSARRRTSCTGLPRVAGWMVCSLTWALDHTNTLKQWSSVVSHPSIWRFNLISRLWVWERGRERVSEWSFSQSKKLLYLLDFWSCCYYVLFKIFNIWIQCLSFPWHFSCNVACKIFLILFSRT